MKSFNTAAFEAKPIFSLTFSNSFITLLGLKTRIGDICVAAPFSGGGGVGAWFTIGVGRSFFSCCFGSGVRRTWLPRIVPVGVSTLYDLGVVLLR